MAHKQAAGKAAVIGAQLVGRLQSAGTFVATAVSTTSVNAANFAFQYAKPRLRMFWEYAKVELRPCTIGELPLVQETFNDMMSTARTGKWQLITARDAFLNTLICVEIVFCFFIGEVLGRGSLVGYVIEGANFYEVTM
ncbi:hypothetical protein BaRGS_00016362 [Batillaria attramentaria]|uniref:ATP synthase subunit g, mitochondrial n=1 Tax=Batillaria attramentaria TaxID=370345 RepID=A0ABD0L0A8_9CAEN|nr:hypothetical protein BaRGS_000956 [Batillaria attramentaria]